MVTVSCYYIHPIVGRFLRLWRCVQVVSDWLTFLLSLFCCQCGASMPVSNSSNSEYVKPVEVLSICTNEQQEYTYISPEDQLESATVPPPIIDAGRACGEPFRAQHLVIDFKQQPGDSKETESKCEQFWRFVHSQPDLEEMLVKPDVFSEPTVTDRKQPSNESPSTSSGRSSADYPALHILKKMEKKGALSTALINEEKNICLL